MPDDLTQDERELLIDLAIWCDDFFDSGEGLWGRNAAALLKRLVHCTPEEEAAAKALL